MSTSGEDARAREAIPAGAAWSAEQQALWRDEASPEPMLDETHARVAIAMPTLGAEPSPLEQAAAALATQLGASVVPAADGSALVVHCSRVPIGLDRGYSPDPGKVPLVYAGFPVRRLTTGH